MDIAGHQGTPQAREMHSAESLKNIIREERTTVVKGLFTWRAGTESGKNLKEAPIKSQETLM
jgi:hypothetical protein